MVPISFPQAALGAEIEIPGIDGPVNLKIPEGTQSGKELRVRGRGVPFLNEKGHGDLVVRVLVQVPRKLTRARNDAVGIARIMQCGWYKEVRVKDLDSHATKALLVSRALLVKIKRDIENQIRGLLKNFLGLVIGRAKMNVFAARAAELAEARPELAAAVEPLREVPGRSAPKWIAISLHLPRQALPGTQIKGHVGPAPIIDQQPRRYISLGCRTGGARRALAGSLVALSLPPCLPHIGRE